MPNRNGTGPDGKGPTGKGLGPCGRTNAASNQAGKNNPRKGLGKGNASAGRVNNSLDKKAPVEKEKS